MVTANTAVQFARASWDGTPPLIPAIPKLYVKIMALLTDSEFQEMERLLANLLGSATENEEEALLRIHSRLKTILANQRDLRGTKAHLLSLTTQTPQ